MEEELRVSDDSSACVDPIIESVAETLVPTSCPCDNFADPEGTTTPGVADKPKTVTFWVVYSFESVGMGCLVLEASR